VGYRNKTYVAFASEDIQNYRMMQAWKANKNIDFDFFDAHDIFISRDTSKPETIKRNLRERLKSAKQVILLGSKDCKRKGDDGISFLAHEIEVILEFNLPVVIVNLDQDRTIDRYFIPKFFLEKNYFTVSVSYQPKIIIHALDNYVIEFSNPSKKGPHQYPKEVYEKLGL
jgi:hypothetical protein